MSLTHSNQKEWNKKTVVFIHGIGLQPAGYSEPLYELLRTEDPTTADAARWHEIAYDSVNTAMEQKVLQFNKAIPSSVDKPEVQAVVSDFLIDLLNYLFSVDPYNWINNIFRKEMIEVVQEGQADGVQQADHEIFIISHSLGTVVSYEALHSILTDAQTLGVSSRFRIKTYFTLGSPLAFIKANQKRIPSLNKNFFLYNQAIGRPARTNTFTKKTESNILDWINISQKKDPVASLVPLTQASANGALSKESLVFDKFNSGLNPHAFDNYIKQYKSTIMEAIRGVPVGTV